MRRVLPMAALLAALLPLAGCSAGKSPAAAPSSSEVPTTTGPARPAGANPFCNLVQTYNDRYSRINPAAVTDPQQFKSLMQEAVNALRDAATNAPASIHADVVLMSQAAERLLDAFRQTNFDVARLPLSALTDLQAPSYVAAAQRLDAYMRQNCP